MITKRIRRGAMTGLAAAIAVAATTQLAAGPAAAGVCGRATAGSYSYTVDTSTTTTTGKNKKATTTTTPSAGTFTLGFSLDGPSCPGSTYAITVASTDGSPLGWKTSYARYYVGTDTASPDPTAAPATTSVTTYNATVTFKGDGIAQHFELAGTTGNGAPYTGTCVSSDGAISNPDGTTQSTTKTACAGGGGGTSYW